MQAVKFPATGFCPTKALIPAFHPCFSSLRLTFSLDGKHMAAVPPSSADHVYDNADGEDPDGEPMYADAGLNVPDYEEPQPVDDGYLRVGDTTGDSMDA